MKIKFYFRHEPAFDCVSMYIIKEDQSGQRAIAQPIDLLFKDLSSYENPEPTLKISGYLSREFLTAMANGLAESGYRHESNDAGELKAIKHHLDDMRKLVFKD